MSSFLSLFIACAASVFVFMTLAFGVAQLRHRYDTADIAWGLGFILVALTGLASAGATARSVLVAVLVGTWGLRLAVHIYLRQRDRPEDHRYTQMRAEWGRATAVRAWAQIFLSQGLLLLIISLPVVVMNTTKMGSLTWLDGLGVVVWLLGFVFEAVGDFQLGKFIADPAHKGKLMTRGLWRYTRHPNYFGEVTQWWGIWLLALSVPYGFWSIVGPLTITILIVKVSGVPLLERAYAGRPDWETYKACTNMLLPWLPKRLV